MQDTKKIKPVSLLESDMDSIIKTNFGSKKIPPCFGYMKIVDPYSVKSGEYNTPSEMEEVRRKYIATIKHLVAQAEKCEKCHLFEKCTRLTQVMK